MTTATNHDGNSNSARQPSRAIQFAGALTTTLAAGGILVLSLTGHSDVIPAVAALGGVGLIGGAAPVTINIIKNVKQP
ncbi:hypothetical protein ABZ424_30370 [Streptomyces sp. NPDC005790]|uniref:hypothetical protein n=1 Tax=Streptomyces sp. NPDC005790 TaxID=3154777 RepID=UPI0033D7BBD8